ncbi:nucleoside recognition membrane protein YjiH [Sinobaca qinghaiensis]|uniref:Nucleoside recognition membrane protein YjiH n=1 Tax=Sinobaca qinghaiensis TaxID=342944 RepID=A0A419UXC5_9BACL|nr:YjiH family protein [Sinobaca qinghaiensis]RKD69774.1 nucleoside recognition membrane protein YjiH [Sinobaca qinghaiensis]
MNSSSTTKPSQSRGSMLRFLIPSIIGILLFMVPVSIGGEVTIVVAILAGWFQGAIGPALPYIAAAFMLAAVIGTIAARFVHIPSPFLQTLFNVSVFWMIVRILGLIFAVMVLFSIGPEPVISDVTGGLLLYDLIPVLISVFLFAGLFLPLLLNFGLLEFAGALLTPIMRPLFKLPGRSSIDCAASWMGDGTIGVLLTNQQYEQGYYTKREAAVIGTTFSVVSITFSIVILEYVELLGYFLPYYFTIIAAGFVAAIIMPRIPPLSRKKDDYFRTRPDQSAKERPSSITPFSWGIRQAVAKSGENGIRSIFSGGIKNVLDMWIGVLPIVMALGTLAVIVAEFTSFFTILGAPFVPLLTLMQVPEAAAASESMLIGFADMFLPAILGAGIESDMTRFIIASLSVTQLIYMSEVGGLLLASKLPVSFLDLVIIFLERTIITLPVIVVCAHFIF